jgi:hypothetical protein
MSVQPDMRYTDIDLYNYICCCGQSCTKVVARKR